jgi:hypothetical protein
MPLYICVPITFLTWRGRVHANNGMDDSTPRQKNNWIKNIQWHGRASTPSQKSHWNINIEWHGHVYAKFKKSLEHKIIYNGMDASMPILKGH